MQKLIIPKTNLISHLHLPLYDITNETNIKANKNNWKNIV
jgi:hypothetical protein